MKVTKTQVMEGAFMDVKEMRNSEILLETGTNELELLEFDVGRKLYGINIAKVREIMRESELVVVPHSAPEIEGVFMPRDRLITIMDLHKVLNTEKPEDARGLLIISEFNEMDIGFHVSNVYGIQRISWTAIKEPPKENPSFEESLATGIATIGDKEIIILDFERIVSDLNKNATLDYSGSEGLKAKNGADIQLVVAEDSAFLNKLIVNSLNDVGFTNIESFPNGQEAWDYISQFSDYEGDISDKIGAIITDIEMPQMDGHRLTKLVKDNKKLADIPVFLFSSLINEQMYKKGLTVGANAQFSKPQIGQLMEKLVKLFS